MVKYDWHVFFQLNIMTWKVSVFWVILVLIFPHSDWIRRDTPYLFVSISPYSVQIRENADQSNSEWGHFLRSIWMYKNTATKIELVYNNAQIARIDNT